MSAAPVAILMVTHNSAGDLAAAGAAIAALAPAPAELVIVDCASEDGSAEAARVAAAAAGPEIAAEVVALDENRGFSGGMNVALARSRAPFALSLNADAQPRPDFLAPLLSRFDGAAGERVGAATGRLVRPALPGEPPRLDACGMRLTRSWRHLDRGSGEVDRGQHAHAARVFGATGAATLFRRAALDDVAIDGQIFDERFHSFREDAELAFRFAERGWSVVYEPAAVAIHRRTVLPSRRASLPPEVNRGSLRNRYLLRLDHQSGTNLFATLPWTLARDLAAVAYALLFERSSLPAYGWLWRNRRALVEHRRRVRSRVTAPPHAVERWFARSEEAL
jgi:GT2 family glycosyltransferase